MKKKLLLLLIIPILLFGFNEKVVAEENSTAKLSYFGTVFSDYIQFTSAGGGPLDGKNTKFYKMKLTKDDGTILYALCFGIGMGNSTGTIYTETSETPSPNYVGVRKAYNYFVSNKNDDNAFIVSQIYLWMIQYGADPANPTYTPYYLGYVQQALQKNGVDIVAQEALVNSYINGMINSSQYSEEIVIWRSGDRQPLVAPSSKEIDSFCTKNDGTKVNITDCVKNKISEGYSKDSAIAACTNQYCPVNRCFGHLIEEGTAAVCNLTNLNNEGNFNQKFVSSCENTANKFGEPQGTISGIDKKFCRLYCMEGGNINGVSYDPTKQSFPGNVSPSVSVGTLLIWPTSNINTFSSLSNIFPLKFSGQRQCHMVMTGTDEDIKMGINPADVYANQYKYIQNNKNKDFKCDFTTVHWGGCKQDTQSNEEVRDDNKLNSLSGNTQECTDEYGDSSRGIIKDLTDKVETAESAIDSWVSTQNAAGGCYRYTNALGVSIYTNCTRGDHPNIGDYNNLVSALNSAKSAKTSCENYIKNYKKMVDYYKGIAACNNFEVTDSNKGVIYNFMTDVSMEIERNNSSGNYDTSVQLITTNDTLNVATKNYAGHTELTVENDDLKELTFFTNNYHVGTTFKDCKNNPTNKMCTLVNKIGGKINGVDSNRIFIGTASKTYTIGSGADSQVINKGGVGNVAKSKYLGFYIPLDSGIGPYELRIYNTHLGHSIGGVSATFDELLNNSESYVCEYEVTYSPPAECKCPPGTKYAGYDLTSKLYDDVTGARLTCEDAKLKYCNRNDELPPDKDELYCPPPYQEIPLSGCLGRGFDYDYCVNELCSSETENTCRCPDDSMPEALTWCYTTNLSIGMNHNDACNECLPLCPLKGGLRIIYRTISLANPFPGKTISSNIPGFNNDVNGRYPGYNWNSTTLVKKHIRFSRDNSKDTNNSDIYNTDEPLYVFELNGTTINAIRSYNDSNKYDDFKLDCKKDDSVACVSSFVHDATYGLTSGKCFSATSKNNFYTCSDDD